VRNAAETFGLDHANLLEALGELHDAWRNWRSCQTGEGSGGRRHWNSAVKLSSLNPQFSQPPLDSLHPNYFLEVGEEVPDPTL